MRRRRIHRKTVTVSKIKRDDDDSGQSDGSEGGGQGQIPITFYR